MAAEILNSSENIAENVLSHEQLMSLAHEFQQRYPDAMNILDITWVSPFRSREMINPYTNKSDTEDFSNVWRHCVAVAYAASKIADNLNLSQEEKDKIIRAALLHDADKRLEVMRKNAQKAWVKIDVYGEEWYKTIEFIFSDKGLDPNILSTIQSMGGMTGHNSLKKFLIVKNGGIQPNPERNIAEMIVHIADDMTHSSLGSTEESTQYVSLEKRAELWRFPERYLFLWTEWLAISETQWATIVKDIWAYISTGGSERLQNYFDWQKITFELICRYIQKQIDPNNSKDSVEFIVGLMNRQNTTSLVVDVAKDVNANLSVK